MAKIKRTPPTAEFELLCRNASELGETNDCAVKAVAVVSGQPYSDVHAMFLKEGRKPRCGTRFSITERVVQKLGLELKRIDVDDIISQYPGSHAVALKGLTSHHPARFNRVWKNGKSYLMITRSHIFAIVDGVSHDWSVGRALRCKFLYEVVRKQTACQSASQDR